MSDQTWYFMDAAGAQQGPITILQLQTLVASGAITRETQVWTEALGEQWIPAANVEGLFVAEATAQHAPALRTSTPAAITPNPAPTTPMIPSTPTTQAVTGVPIPAGYTQQQQPQPQATPQEAGIYPPTIAKGGSMGLWCMLSFGGLLCIILGAMIGGIFTQSIEPTTVGTTLTIGFVLVGIGTVCILLSSILIYIYLYRAWKCLQPGGATVSPGAAIGFMFIPLFNIYWLFKAIGGLPRQWNLITSSYTNTQNAPKLTLGAFICMLLIPIIGQIIWLSQITKGLNFMAALHFQQSRPTGSALAGLGSRANFQ